MPMDAYAVVGALVRAEITRTHTQPTRPPTPEAAAPDEIITPKPTAAAASPTPARGYLRTRVTLVLRRLTAVGG
ncbi:hypothetical protein [Streptomyces sp. CdTB01]|uniref:hypothetical protein n=1 Tax=Streptomyces sp. CdTB01 TaxID=1725411 RepID=UPI00073A6B0D|nr:hypothetical protein [Streptomyces sp. CdTB01]ALV33526.1 hypothetical protein AS200_16885 [Streptomyces sp. CdTB01]